MESSIWLRSYLMSIIFLFLNLRYTCLAGYCTQSSQCRGNCYRVQSTDTSCGIFGWSWASCTKYRVAVYSCTYRCYKRACCPGYEGPNCDTPLCYGDTSCPNGGTCLSPDSCLCPPGHGSIMCSDIDECSLGVSGCQQQCHNTPGSYYCSCNDGYVLAHNSQSCQDLNECGENKGGCDQVCVNVEGSHTCECHSGYELETNGQTCTDIDECTRNISGCDHSCNNTAGSFVCSCQTGYTLGNDGKTCSDTDECARNISGCDHSCNNTAGSFVCSCVNGYMLGNDGKTCYDIDECTRNISGCEHSCNNTAGSFACSCPTGYMLGNYRKECYDIDECTRNISGCEHSCNNTAGSFACSCQTGYMLGDDGKTCNDMETIGPHQDDQNGLSTGGIIGIVLACVGVVILAVIIIVYVGYKRGKNTEEGATSNHFDNIAYNVGNAEIHRPGISCMPEHIYNTCN